MTQLEKARLLDSLHVAGDPLIVTNIWDAVTARTVAAAPGVRAIATASHAVTKADDHTIGSVQATSSAACCR